MTSRPPGSSSRTRAQPAEVSATRPNRGSPSSHSTPNCSEGRWHIFPTPWPPGFPGLRVEALPARYEDLLRHDLPLGGDEIERMRSFASAFEHLCTELASRAVPETIQHDDLHMNNVFDQGGRLRVLDWG